MEERELVYLCALSRVLLFRPAAVRAVLSAGYLREIFEGPADAVRELFRGDGETVAKLCNPALPGRTAEDLEWMRRRGVAVLGLPDGRYPRLLRECADAPPVLYYAGTADLNRVRSLSVVGTRLASQYGRESCRALAAYFAEKGYRPLLVSGLAFGIDICVHRAALDFGMETVGVLACGIDRIYPCAHRGDAVRMTEAGGILTEFPRGTPPLKIHFIKRNRIIAGMTQGVLVAESRIRGGAMSTAEFAAGYGREVFALPGRMDDANFYGCNYLIAKNVARICNHPSAVPEALGWAPGSTAEIGGQYRLFSGEESEKQKIIVSLNTRSPADTETICNRTGLTFRQVSLLLLELELEGRIACGPDNQYRIRK